MLVSPDLATDSISCRERRPHDWDKYVYYISVYAVMIIVYQEGRITVANHRTFEAL